MNLTDICEVLKSAPTYGDAVPTELMRFDLEIYPTSQNDRASAEEEDDGEEAFDAIIPS